MSENRTTGHTPVGERERHNLPEGLGIRGRSINTAQFQIRIEWIMNELKRGSARWDCVRTVLQALFTLSRIPGLLVSS